MRKPLIVMLSTLTIISLSACNFSFGFSSTHSSQMTSEDVANETMLRAMANMTSMTIGSFDVTITTDSTVSHTRNVEENTHGKIDESTHLTIDASINAQVDDFWGDNPMGALNLTINEASIEHWDENKGTSIDQSFTNQVFNAYYQSEFGYLDFSTALDLHALLSEMQDPENPLPTRAKVPLPSDVETKLPNLTNIENIPTSSEVDTKIAELLPIMAMMPNLTTAMVGNELRITYELTSADLPDLVESVMLEVARQENPDLPSSLDSSMQAEFDAEVNRTISMIDLDEFRIEVGINTTRNILSYFEVAIDVTLTIDDRYDYYYWDEQTSQQIEDDIAYTEVIDIDTTTRFVINKFSEPVTITLPEDLEEYELFEINWEKDEDHNLSV